MGRMLRKLAVVTLFAAAAATEAGSNLPKGYPGPGCGDPPEAPDASEIPGRPEVPERPETFETRAAIDEYNAKVDAYNAAAAAYNAKADAYAVKVDAYNASMERFVACVNEYVANAAADLDLVRERAREAIDRLEAIRGLNE